MEIANTPPPNPATKLKKIRNKVKFVVESLFVRIAVVLLIFLDLSIMITEFAKTSLDNNLGLYVVSVVILVLFLIEILLRIFAFGLQFFKNPIDLLDLAIVLTCLIVYFFANNVARVILVVRFLRIIRIFIISYREYKNVQVGTRRFVSQNKRRLHEGNFELDLTYVTDRVVAMSVPATKFERFYRNPIDQVASYFQEKHRDDYKVYNLCSERSYPTEHFGHRVESFPIDDHNPPTLKLMLEFCENVKAWFDSNEKNIIAVHCRGGKGRTGSMICAWLMYSAHCASAEEALQTFAEQRTDMMKGKKFQGVETPSQERYIGYFEKVVKQGALPLPVHLRIQRVTITGFKNPKIEATLTCHVYQKGNVVYDSNSTHEKFQKNESGDLVLTSTSLSGPIIFDDVKMRFFADVKIPKPGNKCLFYFWFHTSFLEGGNGINAPIEFILTREKLDNPHQKKNWKIFPENFAVKIELSPL